MENTYTIEIDAARPDVFAFLDDPDNLKDIVPNLVDQGVIQETPEKVGTTFWHEYEEKGRRMKMQGVVTEHEEPESMAVALDGAFFALEVRYRLAELGPNKTALTQDSKARFKHIFKLMGLLMGKKMKADGERVQAENFARMKQLIEARYGAAE